MAFVSTPNPEYQADAMKNSLVRSSLASLSTVGSTNLSAGTSSLTSAVGSLSTVSSTNLSASTSRATSLSTILSVTTSTANSG